MKLDHFLIERNMHTLEVIHSIYIAIRKKLKYSKVSNKQKFTRKMKIFVKNLSTKFPAKRYN